MTRTDEPSAASGSRVAPLWLRSGAPSAAAGPVAQLWRYADVRPLLDAAAAEVSIEDADRRVLMFVNDALGEAEATSTTLQANVQLVQPGEFAAPHRHTMTAVRVGIEGTGVITTVDGVAVPIEPGDIVLTPAMRWHDHRHVGDMPVIWLDVLDRPLVERLGMVRFERLAGDDPASPAPANAEPFTVTVPWAATAAALDAAAGGDRNATVSVEVTDPLTGGPLTPTIGVRAGRIATGTTVELGTRRSTRVIHVRSGSGTARVGDVALEWTAADTFVAPPGESLTITTGDSTAEFLSFSDDPALRALGLGLGLGVSP